MSVYDRSVEANISIIIMFVSRYEIQDQRVVAAIESCQPYREQV